MEPIPVQWKCWQGEYWVSDNGDVKRVCQKSGIVHKLNKYRKEESGGFCVKIKGKHRYVARLVWETFRGEIPEGYVVMHKNGCRTMDDLTNLALVFKYDHVKYFYGGRALRKKVIDLNTGIVYLSTIQASKALFCTHRTVSNCCNRRYKTSCLNVEWYDPDKIYPMELKFVREPKNG